MIYVVNKRRKIDRIKKEFPNADILDVTSQSDKRYAQLLSPFYPHGNIPIPYSPGYYATCVEAIWQGLKVFQSADIDMAMFNNATMKNLKRTVKRFGKPLGHRKGVLGTELLNYLDARMLIYLPLYKWVLDNIDEVQKVVCKIKERSQLHDIVFLDYNTNINVRDISAPLSHAALIKLYIEGEYPSAMNHQTPINNVDSISCNKEVSTNKQLTIW